MSKIYIYKKHVDLLSYAMTMVNFSNLSWGVSKIWNWRYSLILKQSPYFANQGFAIQSDLTQALYTGIKKGIWTPVQFNDWDTPIVPVRKKEQNNASGAHLRDCGDYSATVNPQLENHCHLLPRPEKLIQRLCSGFGFTKINLADAVLDLDCLSRISLST